MKMNKGVFSLAAVIGAAFFSISVLRADPFTDAQAAEGYWVPAAPGYPPYYAGPTDGSYPGDGYPGGGYYGPAYGPSYGGPIFYGPPIGIGIGFGFHGHHH